MAPSLIEGARAGEELEDLSYHEQFVTEVEELATLILEQEHRMRENLGDLWLKLRQGGIPINALGLEGTE